MEFELRADRLRDWARLCVESLAAARSEIDLINVFPVADGDTGTNAYLTFHAAHRAVADLPADVAVEEFIRVYSEAILVGAKGNSGTILSELVRGSLRELRDHGKITAATTAAAFGAASDAAYAAVGEPREGTILSVAATASKAATQSYADGDDAAAVFERAASAARQALADTPMQMELLARSGVVDAGGRALVVVLDATAQALTGRIPQPVDSHVEIPAELMSAPVQDALSEDGPAYEVMYLLRTPDHCIPGLRHSLSGLGDSLVVVGGDGLWNVHIHVDDVGAAIEAGLAVGTPFRINVMHFAEQIARRHERAPARQRAIVAAVTGEAMAHMMTEAGVTVMSFGPDESLTVDAMTSVFEEVDAQEIIVLPNRHAHIAQFESAAKPLRDRGVRVAVIPTTVQVQGIAALAVHDPHLPFDDAVIAMSTAVGHVRHGAVTVAVSDGITSAGPCRAGDVLGVVNGDFAVIGSSIEDVAVEVLTALDVKSAELVTIVTGADLPESRTESITASVEALGLPLEVDVFAGGQQNYQLFLAVE